jgi:hypothetical protein
MCRKPFRGTRAAGPTLRPRPKAALRSFGRGIPARRTSLPHNQRGWTDHSHRHAIANQPGEIQRCGVPWIPPPERRRADFRAPSPRAAEPTPPGVRERSIPAKGRCTWTPLSHRPPLQRVLRSSVPPAPAARQLSRLRFSSPITSATSSLASTRHFEIICMSMAGLPGCRALWQ